MKKGMYKIIAYLILFLALLIIILGLFFPDVLLEYVVAPALSPFIPDMAPFEASVTLSANKAPLILNVKNEILVCEDTALAYYFNVSDIDKNLEYVRIDPPDPFYAEKIDGPNAAGIYGAWIFSGILLKNRVDRDKGYKTYRENLSAIDSTNLIDSRALNITVIEINHKPNVSMIGVKTVWTYGDDSIFNEQVKVDDIEDGTQNDGKLIFNLTFLDGAPNLFNISKNGLMYFIPNETLNLSNIKLPITYNLSVCVNDTGLKAIHPSIGICKQEGNGFPLGFCQKFSITVTNENRAPIITSYFPDKLNFSANGEKELYFNITSRDPDGSIPDSYWYVDNVSMKKDYSTFFSEFKYTFSCGVSGIHSIRVDVTDGLLNASLEWNVDVEGVSCPSPPGSSGGGGGGSISKCKEAWGCLDWSACQDMKRSFELGILNNADNKKITADCKNDFIPDDSCGFQIRSCQDVNSCKTVVYKPNEIQRCYFTKNATCTDGIKNCHQDSCELLIDCGGPCAPCATCSDGIQNQKEEGVDCGGPCSLECSKTLPIVRIAWFRYILILIILLLFIIVIIQLIRMWLRRKKIKEHELLVVQNQDLRMAESKTQY